MSGLFNELKRRNVIRVGVAYVVAGWVLLQIGDVLFDFLEVPDWAGRLLVAFLALGFPLALIFSWAYELTPEGLKAEAEVDRSASITGVTAKKLDMVTIALVITALAVYAADRLLVSQRTPSTTRITTGVKTAAEASVAVLPFENISQDAANEPFTIGIHDDLLTHISKIGSLKTISRTSVLRYRNTTLPVRQISQELGVATVLSGGVQRVGNRVRINVQLIDANEEYLWAERYDRELTVSNIFAIQSEIATAIALALQATLSPEEKKIIAAIPTESLEAYDAYLLGNQRMTQRNLLALAKAVDYFQKAIALDPDFALAYAHLAETYQLQEDWGDLPRDEMFAKAEPAIKKALELNEHLGAAHNALGGLKHYKDDIEGAEKEYKKAIELSPNHDMTYIWYGTLLLDMGRLQEALALYEKSVELDPLSPINNENVANALRHLGRMDESLARLRKVVEIEPTYATSYFYMGNIQWAAYRQLDKAVALHEKSISLAPRARIPQAWHGLLYLDLGSPDDAEHWIKRSFELQPNSQEPNAAMALLHAYRGESVQALAFADKALELIPYYPDARLLQWQMLTLIRNESVKNGDYASAVARYKQAYPVLLKKNPEIDFKNYRPAIDLAYLLQRTGEEEHAKLLLDRSLSFIQSPPKLGTKVYGIADFQIYALQGRTQEALTALRDAIDNGWGMFWWLYLEHDPILESLRDQPAFLAMAQELKSEIATQLASVQEMETSID